MRYTLLWPKEATILWFYQIRWDLVVLKKGQIMSKEVRAFIDAHKKLPAGIHNAAVLLQQYANSKTGLTYLGALEVLDMAQSEKTNKRTISEPKVKRKYTKTKAKKEKQQKSWTPQRRAEQGVIVKKRKGFGGNVKPQSVQEVKERSERDWTPADAHKGEIYRAVYHLLKKGGKDGWVPGVAMRESGINTTLLRKGRRMQFYVPNGFAFEAKVGCGYRVVKV